MGICNNNQKKSSSKNQHITYTNHPQSSSSMPHSNPNNAGNSNLIKAQNQDSKFQNMPEWEGEIYKGIGIKCMRAYKCSLNIDQLNELRDQFWSSKKKGSDNDNWKYIHQACVYDHNKGEEYLLKHSFKTVNGCIDKCVDKEGNIYCIPNYCINDPYFEHEIRPNDTTHNEIINIVIIDLCFSRNTDMKVSVSTTGSELRELYSKLYEIDLTQSNIRFIFGGAFIKDTDTLYQHKLKDKYSVQVLINKIE